MRSFPRWAPSKNDKSVKVPIRVTDMRPGDASWWDFNYGPSHVLQSSRADRKWVWSVLLPACKLVQQRKRRFCRGLVVWARNDAGMFRRAGMFLMIEHYYHLDSNHPNTAHFLWFLSVADSGILSAHGFSHPPSLLRVLLDLGIVLSQNMGLDGRIGLHAARAGGQPLMDAYAKCKLTNLPGTAPLPAPVTRRNDGRFFYADEPLAEDLALRLDPSR